MSFIEKCEKFKESIVFSEIFRTGFQNDSKNKYDIQNVCEKNIQEYFEEYRTWSKSLWDHELTFGQVDKLLKLVDNENDVLKDELKYSLRAIEQSPSEDVLQSILSKIILYKNARHCEKVAQTFLRISSVFKMKGSFEMMKQIQKLVSI